ncbi:MAG: hypothetical protein JNM84_02425 [Planctomycetes bacterium]|nr:hypothetical protein [Planctomycetota bacterium]
MLSPTLAAQQAPRPDLLHYRFNEPFGSILANDASPSPAPPFATLVTSSWSAPAEDARYGPSDRFGQLGGSIGIAQTPPYRNIVPTGWPLRITGSFTISWRQKMILQPQIESELAYFFGSGELDGFRCFSSGFAGLRIAFRGSPLGDVASSRIVQVPRWIVLTLVCDDAARESRWYSDGQLDLRRPYPAGVNSVATAEGRQFYVGAHADESSSATRFFKMDDFRFYGRALSAAEVALVAQGESAGATRLRLACAPSGVLAPSIALQGVPAYDPSLLGPLSLQLGSLEPGRTGFLVVGLSGRELLGLPILPWSLPSFGSGCALGASLDVVLPLATGTGSLALPLDLGAAGWSQPAHLYFQAFVLGSAGGYASDVLDVCVRER